MVPADPKWCTYCITSKDGKPCPSHTGPDGEPVEYSGHDVYKPSEWVLEVVGKRYNSLSGPCLCFGYDPRHGFWIKNEATGEERNVSERAIGKTIHRIRD